MSSTCRSRRRGPEPMDGSADRPAVAFEDFVDDLDPDRGYRGITRDAMIAWMRVAYELSDGAARAELKQALVSGKVKIFATRDGRDGWEENIFECDEDGPLDPALDLPLLRLERASRWERELREQPNERTLEGKHSIREFWYDADDLRWQIEQQRGKPLAPKVPKQDPKRGLPPPQEELNEALLDHARERGEKLKQSDKTARDILVGMDARDRQTKEAFRALPEEYRYRQARPCKSSN